MKTISTFGKKIICNLVIVLTAAAATYDFLNYILYDGPKPKLLFVIICLAASYFASLKKEAYNKV